MREFLLRLAGVMRREDREWQRTAVLGIWILAPYQKKDRVPMTPEQLLGRRLKLYPGEADRNGEGDDDD